MLDCETVLALAREDMSCNKSDVLFLLSAKIMQDVLCCSALHQGQLEQTYDPVRSEVAGHHRCVLEESTTVDFQHRIQP